MDERAKVERALRSLGAPGKEGEEAFDHLCRDARKVLRIYLRRFRAFDQDIEDVIQKVLVAVYDHRNRLNFETVKQWYRYIHQAAKNSLIDLPISDRPPPDDKQDANAGPWDILQTNQDRNFLYSLADDTWLGPKPLDANSRLLAAKFFYHKPNRSLQDAFDFASIGAAQEKPKTCKELLGWFNDIWLLRKLAFDTLYMSNDQLAAHLLSLPDYSEATFNSIRDRCDKEPAHAMAVGGWKWVEVVVILHRFRYATTVDKILQKSLVRLEKVHVLAIDARCMESFPFVDVMTSLWRRLDGHPLRKNVLTDNPLWKRLVFHYHCVNALQQEDILKRVSPPAAVAEYSLHNINTWIAGRLQKELLDQLAKRSP